jgi:hypothetical protein
LQREERGEREQMQASELPSESESKMSEDTKHTPSSKEKSTGAALSRVEDLENEFAAVFAKLSAHIVSDIGRLKVRCAKAAIEELCVLAQIQVSEGDQRLPAVDTIASRSTAFFDMPSRSSASRFHSSESIGTIGLNSRRSPQGVILAPPTGSMDAFSPTVPNGDDEAAMMAELLVDARRTPIPHPTGRRSSITEVLDGAVAGVKESVMVAKRLVFGDGATPVPSMSRNTSQSIFFHDPKPVRKGTVLGIMKQEASRANLFSATKKSRSSRSESNICSLARQEVLWRESGGVAGDGMDFRRSSLQNSQEVSDSIEGSERILGSAAVHPDSTALFWWQCMIITLVTFSAVEVPYVVGFDSQLLPSFVTVIVEIIFLGDVCLNFLTGYVDKFTHDTILDIRLTASKYFTSFFVLDLVASIPSECITVLRSDSSLGNIALFKGLRMIKIFRLVRLLRIDPFKNVEGETINPALLRLFKLICVFLFVLHLIACGYWFLARDEGLGSDVWVPPDELGEKGWQEQVLYWWCAAAAAAAASAAATLTHSRLHTSLHQYAFAYHWAILIIIGNDANPVTYSENIYSGARTIHHAL